MRLLRLVLALWLPLVREPENRVRGAVQVLRGKPLAYKLFLDEGTLVLTEPTKIFSCRFKMTGDLLTGEGHPAIRIDLPKDS